MPLDLDKFIRYHIKRRHAHSNKNLKYNVDEVTELCQMAKKIFREESSLSRINPPVLVVGDIHGQFYDLLRVFGAIKTFDSQDKNLHGCMNHKMVFLGDYVDRGRHSMECICLVLALKCKWPHKYVLLRGNHESRSVNRDYGFWDELNDRFGNHEVAEKMWEEFNQVFALMPLAGLIGGRILCMHGGISPDLNTLKDIEDIKRPLDDPFECPLANDLLWADPMVNMTGFRENQVRGVSVFFGEDRVTELCDRLGLSLIIRAHQVMASGFGFFAGRKLLTIFTAPRYQPELDNLGTVVKIHEDGRLGMVTMRPSKVQSEQGSIAPAAGNSSSGSLFFGKEAQGERIMEEKRKTKKTQKAKSKMDGGSK